MKILLDTHILLWLLVGDPMLSRSARKILEDARNEIFFSSISIAEIAIKHVKNPELMPVTSEEVRDAALEDNLHELNFESVHAVAGDQERFENVQKSLDLVAKEFGQLHD